MKAIFTLLLAGATLYCTAQTKMNKETLDKYPAISTSNYIYYDTSVKIFNEIKTGKYDYPTLTKAPKGYTPFYISHYGRHGSRYHYSQRDYSWWAATLDTAKNEGYLNELGLQIEKDMALLCKDAEGRAGDLTPAGRKQHQGIAKRMMANFPEIFKGKGAVIDAKSTVVPRCLLSMDAFCQELRAKYPDLTINNDAGQCFQYYMMNEQDGNRPMVKTDEWKKASMEFYMGLGKADLACKRLFKDVEAAGKRFNLMRVEQALYNATSTLQGVELEGVDQLRTLLTPEEMLNSYKSGNFYWYSTFACVPQLGGVKNTHCAANLAAKIIEEAEAVLNGESNVKANLRFGHDSALMPLLSILNINGAGTEIEELATLHNTWSACEYVPMAGNVQIIFYKNAKDAKADILVKILQNETEAKLPIGDGPYYKWNEVKAYWLKRIEDSNY